MSADVAHRAVDLIVAGLEHGELADAAAAVEDARLDLVAAAEQVEAGVDGKVDPIAVTDTVSGLARTVVGHIPGAAAYMGLVDIVLGMAQMVAWGASRTKRIAQGDHVVEVDLRG